MVGAEEPAPVPQEEQEAFIVGHTGTEGVSFILYVGDLYYSVFTVLYRFRHTVLQGLIPSYRFRHRRVIKYFIYCAT